MPSWVVRQPNGLLATFSTIVDDFTMMNASEEEMLDYWSFKIGAQEAAAKVRRGLDDEGRDAPPGKQDGAADGLGRWREALETVRLVHGEATAKRRAALDPS